MSEFIYISSVILICLLRTACPSCIFQNGKYDLSALDWPKGWQVSAPAFNNTLYHYEISLCKPYESNVSNDCSKSSICQIHDNKYTSFGNAIESENDVAIADNAIAGGFSIYLHTKTPCGTFGVHRAVINFACGPHLGAPELTLRSECQVNFYWKTYAACPEKPKFRQVPCYVIDDNGQKRDLSHLIMKEGGYVVNTPNPNFEFFINVCSEMMMNNETKNCPTNSSACRVTGNEYLSFGYLTDRLQNSKEGLLLTYRVPEISAGCPLEPKTKILFKCPSRGHSQPPKLISDLNCQYEVEWETEYACPENLLKGSLKTCQFSTETHGVEIDLSPLRKKVVHGIVGKDTNHNFSLSVCGGLGDFVCGGKHWKTTSACMSNATDSRIIGSINENSQLIYADGEVSLLYPKGNTCDNGAEETTVINFVCDINAVEDGEGEPHHILSGDCVNIFEWATKYACLKHELDIPCSVTFDKKKVSLQKLLLPDGEAYEVFDARNVPHDEDSSYLINVCGRVSNESDHCGDGSSACVLRNGNYTNLGNFTSPPVYDHESDSVRLIYTGGSPCRSGKFWQSVINFICRPGHINTKPTLTKIDENECKYEFEWYTAEACPLGIIEGSDCKVYDKNLGINYDLTPLKSKSYEVDSEHYTFYLSVCKSLENSPCNSNSTSRNIGICQVEKSSKNSRSLGQSTSDLSYMDGVINLSYLNGDPYFDKDHTARVSIIIFICHYEAGYGAPQYVEAVNFAHIFHWYTSLVCSRSKINECLVRDSASHLLYDLGGLSLSEQNWVTVINDDGKERRVYLNVCRSLALPIPCDPNAAACLVEPTDNSEKVIIPNLGRAVNSPELHSPGRLSLKYTNGSSCLAFGNNITYSTVIHFLCPSEGSGNGGITFLNKNGACEYAFLWATKAACPSETLQSVETCQLTEPDSGFTFDLTPLYLQNESYNVSSSLGTFMLNICGKVSKGCSSTVEKFSNKNISACKIDKVGKMSALATSDSYILSYSSGEDLTLTYKSENKTAESNINKVLIKFPCSNTSDLSPKFIHQDDEQYIFEMKTSLACIPSQFDCTIIDNLGYEYDLSPLTRYTGSNWEVSDYRPEYVHIKYHLNFCRPLNKIPFYKCPGGASAACQTSKVRSEESGFDLGSQMSKPVVNENGSIVIHYSNGSYCDNGQVRRSTTINLICSERERELKFIGESPECEYFFSLETPIACPVQSNKGSNCMVKDPLFGYMFDLSPLKSKNSNYYVSVHDYNYTFNICDSLNNFSSECSNSSVCQTKPKDPKFFKSLGQPSNVLSYKKGIISLKYENGTGDCHGIYNRSTTITFYCHHAHEDTDGPIFIDELQDCTYLFEWPTVHACPPFDVMECSVTDTNGLYYDLSSLSLPNDNYYIKYPDSSEKTFVINVCRSVVHSSDSLCPYTSAACLTDSKRPDQPLSLGRIARGPFIEDGKIKISYTTGDPCNIKGLPSARFMQTVIEFSCDEESIESEPDFIGQDDCTYYFDWSTAYACPVKTAQSSSDCTVRDPTTGYMFNLSVLKDHGPFVTQKNGHKYHLSICGSQIKNLCGGDSGMCQEELVGEKRKWSGGQVNGNLTLNDNNLVLNYTSGDLCHQGKFQRNTLIEFHCGHGIGEPKFVYESQDCTYFFSWKTELACQTSIHCAVKNGSSYFDLTPFTGSYHIASSSMINDRASYYISVCSSLPKITNVNCSSGAAICKVTNNLGSTSTESLGKVERPPLIDFMGHATILYTNGSTCPTNANLKNRARIIFLCDSEAGVGEPVLIDEAYDECLYIFEWKTSILCPEKHEITPMYTSCNYTDNSRGIHFDMSPLQRTGMKPYYEVTDSGKHNTFFLNVCGNLGNINVTNCVNAGVCVKESNTAYSYGVASSQRFTYDGRRLRLTLYEGDDCPSGLNGKRTSEIFFTCDPSAGIGEPVVHKKYTCLVVFMWKTAFVCQNIQQRCAFDIDGIHYDFNLLSSLSHNWNTTDGKNIYWINMCRGIQQTPATLGCNRASAICMVDPQGYPVPLGLVQTMKVKSINSTDLLFTFDSGSRTACSSPVSNSSKKAVTRLFMKCGTTLGEPKIFSGPDSECYYDFAWTSSLACEDKVEEVLLEENGMIKDKRLDYSFDIRDILNYTFDVPGSSVNDHYVYKINLSGVTENITDPNNLCAKAAICQTKPNSSFLRDIGSLDTRAVILRGSELHMSFVSHTRPCGKNQLKNVTTIINFQCVSAAGIGSPTFLYESGDCDYIFNWDTIVMCPDFHRHSKVDPENKPQVDPNTVVAQSSHTTSITVGIIFTLMGVMVLAFILLKAERRAILSARVRSLFGRVSVPYFRYKRGDILTELQSDF